MYSLGEKAKEGRPPTARRARENSPRRGNSPTTIQESIQQETAS